MLVADAALSLRTLGNEMESMLAQGLPEQTDTAMFPYSEEPLTLLGAFKREPVMKHFWLESQRVAGALLLNHRTCQLQKDEIFESIRLWQQNAEFDDESAHMVWDSTGDSRASLDSRDVRQSMAEKAARLGRIMSEVVRVSQATEQVKVAELEHEMQRLRSSLVIDLDRVEQAEAAAEAAEEAAEEAVTAARRQAGEEAMALLATQRTQEAAVQAQLLDSEAKAREQAGQMVALRAQLDTEMVAQAHAACVGTCSLNRHRRASLGTWGTASSTHRAAASET